MFKIKVSNKTYIIARPEVKEFISQYVPPDDVDIVLKDLIAVYIRELSGFNILDVILKRAIRRNALFILPHRIYTTVGKHSSDVFVAGVFTFAEDQITDNNNMVDANLSFIIGKPHEVIKLLNSLDKRGLKIAAFIPATKCYTNEHNIDLSNFEHIINE